MKKAIVLIMIMLAGFALHAQRFYFFCINLSDNTDGAYVSGVIDGVLKQMGKNDEFVIYIRGGVNSEGKVFDAVRITDNNGWQEAKDLLDYIDRCSVLSKSEVDMMRKTFQPWYVVGDEGLEPKRNILVYWFGDEAYYSDYGKSIILPFYYALDGERTWEACYLYGDNKKMKSASPQERLGVSIYSISKMTIK